MYKLLWDFRSYVASRGHRSLARKEGAGLHNPQGPLPLTCSDSTDLEQHRDQVLFWLIVQVHGH